MKLRLFQRHPQPTIDRDQLKDTIHFFGAHAFEQWAFVPANHAAKMGNHRIYTTYKEPLKRYICDGLTGDWNYYVHKKKEGSLCRVNDCINYVTMGIDDRLNVIRFGASCLSMRQMCRTYQASSATGGDGHPLPLQSSPSSSRPRPPGGLGGALLNREAAMAVLAQLRSPQ